MSESLPPPTTPPSPFVNCTPHEITLFDGDSIQRFYPSGTVLRATCDKQRELPFQHLGVPVVSRQIFQDVVGLDGVAHGSYILVSMPVGEKLAQRTGDIYWWVFGPDTSPAGAVRDKDGKIIGTSRFVLYAVPSDTKYDCAICNTQNLEISFCPVCETDLAEECCHIDGTELHIVDATLRRRVVE